ncbi:MAG: hypothetical protein KM310_03845 [Clostridiales bacterium]|nr:hypothetical protein [Clostridiales bacterium]
MPPRRHRCGPVDGLTARVRLDSQEYDASLREEVAYRPRRLAWAFPGMGAAGLPSGL